MFKEKCPSCNKKVKKSYGYCPFCGCGLRENSEREDFGLLGRNDSSSGVQEELKLPFGLNKMVNSLVKQFEREMNSLDNLEGNNENLSGVGIPRGFQVRISTGRPGEMSVRPGSNSVRKNPVEKSVPVGERISAEEYEKRMNLERIEATSSVRRLSDRIIYEISTPGVVSKKDIILTKLASGLEIRAYSKDKCYVKFIPLTVEVIGVRLTKDKVFVELKS
ncbi:MAG: hypothetical protein ABIF88_00925 [archaeon]